MGLLCVCKAAPGVIPRFDNDKELAKIASRHQHLLPLYFRRFKSYKCPAAH